MDGLIGGLLGYLQDPRRTQQVQGIGNAIERGLLRLQESDKRFKDLYAKAFDPKDPLKVRDKEALKELTDMTMTGLLGFAPAGLTVFHGSPAKFSKFDPTKIGTGEGAQAYGYGHYVAESPAVADEYRMMLSPHNVVGDPGKDLASYSLRVKKDKDSAIKYLQDEKQYQIEQSKKTSQKIDKDYLNQYDDAILYLQKGQINKPGSLYKIDLPDEQIAKMLDYDKPIKDQPEVLNVIRGLINDADIAKSFETNVKSGISGANAYMNYVSGKTPLEKSEILRQAGIPGIRYLDQGSRGRGQGTSNFVVFPGNEDLLRILERNNSPIGLLD